VLNDLDLVSRLAEKEATVELFGVVLAKLKQFGLDSDDLRSIIHDELDEHHFMKSKPTKKYHSATVSDY
jgi:hypothetical protein